MNGGKNVEFLDWGLIIRHGRGLAVFALVDHLVDVELRSVVVPVELGEVPVLMPEHATGSIHTVLLAVEGPAIIRLEPGSVTQDCGFRQFILTVSISALGVEAAFRRLDPVAAQLSLVLAIGVWHLELRSDRRQAWI